MNLKLIKMAALPTISLNLSTPMMDWFSNMTQLYNIVQKQSDIIKNLQDRIAVLEHHSNIETSHVVPLSDDVAAVSAVAAVAALTKQKTKKVVKTAKTAKATTKTAKTVKAAIEHVAADAEPHEIKKRGRKPTTDVSLSEFLRQGEQIIARIPLGNRQFDEHIVTFQDGQLVLEDGQTFEHPTTLVGALAKMLEDIGERSTDCSKSLNGWLLCTVSRGGKRVPLEKIKTHGTVTDVSADVSSAEDNGTAEN